MTPIADTVTIALPPAGPSRPFPGIRCNGASRHSFEALGINFFAAGDAFSETPFAYARERSVDHVEQLTVIIALAEEEFLVVRTGGAIGDVLRGLIVRQCDHPSGCARPCGSIPGAGFPVSS